MRSMSGGGLETLWDRLNEEQPKPKPLPNIHVLFPRQNSYTTSLEIKKRLLAQAPHMGGTYLKKLCRRHVRKGTYNSFVAEFESRLDRVCWRLGLAPSMFAIRFLLTRGHIMVNGRVTTRPAATLRPMDIIEVKPSAVPFLKKNIQHRLRLNTFVIVKEGSNPFASASSAARDQEAAHMYKPGISPPKESVPEYDIERLKQDVGELTVGHELPKEDFNALQADDAHSRTMSRFELLVHAMLPALCAGHPLADELRKRQAELSVYVPTPPKEERGHNALASRASIAVCWQPSAGAPRSVILELDRAKTRRMMLAMLALRPAEAATEAEAK